MSEMSIYERNKCS